MMIRERTKDVARSRLACVLREDRTNLTMKELALMQLDILAALSAYVDMVRDQARITVTKDRKNDRIDLTFTVPICTVKRKK